MTVELVRAMHHCISFIVYLLIFLAEPFAQARQRKPVRKCSSLYITTFRTWYSSCRMCVCV